MMQDESDQPYATWRQEREQQQQQQEEEEEREMVPSSRIETTDNGNSNNNSGNGQEPLVDLDPCLFRISDEEREMALVIKEAIDDMPDLKGSISDFMCVQLAIAGDGDVEWAVDRAYKMQEVQQEYSIALTYEDGKRALEQCMRHFPNWFLSFTFDPKRGSSVVVMDFAQAVGKKMKNQAVADCVFRAAHYLCYVTFPSLETVRVGGTHIFECSGYDWSLGMMKIQMLMKLTHVSHDAFPSVLSTRWYHTPSMANVMFSMTKRYVSEDVSSRWQVGCKFAGGRLDKFYFQPTPEVARQKFMSAWNDALRLRFESERQFKLSKEY